MYKLFRVFFFFFIASPLFAQQDGVIDDPGDIAFIAFERVATEGYAFVFMDDCPPGTCIIFDDEEWDGTNWASSTFEGANTWKNDTGEKIPIGTVIIVQNADDPGPAPDTISVNIGSITESDAGFLIANNMDGIFAYVGSFRDPNPDFLAYVGELNAGGQSLVGTGLVAGTTALDDESLGTGNDEGIYTAMNNCMGTQLQCLQMLNDPDNWTQIDASTTFPASIPSLICVEETVPTLTASPTTICGSSMVTLTIDTCLNAGNEWAVYTGSCGGTEVARTTDGSVMVSPTMTTTYFIRGESTECAGNVGDCAMVTVTVADAPIAMAGDDETLCEGNPFTLAANTPNIGTGMWTIISGTPNITSPTSPTSTVDIPIGSSATLAWTVSNGICPDAMDQVTLTNDEMPSAAAGMDQSACDMEDFTMVATAPPVGSGVWAVESGAANIDSPNSPTSIITVAVGTSATLSWTVSNGVCPDAADEIILTNDAMPTAAAGMDQKSCEVADFTLAATSPTIGTGVWSIVIGSPAIDELSSPTSAVTVPLGTTATLAWTVSNGVCTDAVDEVEISNHQNPTAAINITENSGIPNDDIICIGDNAQLTATGGTSFQWAADPSLSALDIAAPIAFPTTTTTYTITVTDDNMCSASTSTTLNVVLKNLTATDTKDKALNAIDPCDCTDRLNKTINNQTLFHDVLTVTSTPGRSIWISLVSSEFRDANNNLLPFGALPTSDPGGNAGDIGTGTLIPETSTPGVYQLDFFHLEGIVPLITYTDGTTFEDFTGSVCNSCVTIPTMSEWGLLIFALLLMNLGVGLILRKENLVLKR